MSNGDVRGYVAVPDVPQERQWGALLSQALGRDGLLTVVKDLRLRSLYQGIVPLQAGDIETDLAYYLNQSEQIPSVLAMGVQLDEEEQVGGPREAFLSRLSPYNPAIVHALGERVAELPPFEELFAQGYTPEAVLETVLTISPSNYCWTTTFLLPMLLS